jgi:hypothetical protein
VSHRLRNTVVTKRRCVWWLFDRDRGHSERDGPVLIRVLAGFKNNQETLHTSDAIHVISMAIISPTQSRATVKTGEVKGCLLCLLLKLALNPWQGGGLSWATPQSPTSQLRCSFRAGIQFTRKLHKTSATERWDHFIFAFERCGSRAWWMENGGSPRPAFLYVK